MRVIQMGIGGMGGAWLERLTPLPFVDFVGFVEVNEENAKQQAERFDLDEALIFKTLPEALSAVEADAVIAVIPPEFRTETLKTCIEANLPLLAEKPLAETMDDAFTQLKLAEDSGLMYAISQDYRYKPPLYTVKDILDSGELGKINAITARHYFGFYFTGFRSEMPQPLLNDMAIHHFDLLRYFLGENPTSLYAKAWSPSWNENAGNMSAHALLTFPEDVHVAYTASWVTTGLPSTFDGDWRFDCEKGVLALENDLITVQLRDDKDKPTYSFHLSEHRDAIELDYDRQAYLAYQLNETVVNGTPMPTRIQDNIHSLQMVFDTIESSNTGQIIHK